MYMTAAAYGDERVEVRVMVLYDWGRGCSEEHFIDQLQMRFVSSSILIVYLRLACGLLLDVCGFPFGCCYRRHFRKIDSFLPILGSPASAPKSRTISYKYFSKME